MSYNLTKQLPSCNVERKLLQELENYARRKVAELAPPPEDLAGVLNQSFTIVDKFGVENLKSVEEYQRTYFPDDTRGISIEVRSFGNPHLSIEFKFSPTKSDSNLRVRFDGNSAREVATGIAAEILSIMESYKTSNHFFHSYLGVPLVLVIFAALLTGFILPGIRLTPTDAVPYLLLNLGLGAVTVLLAVAAGEKFKPYSAFETRRNERLKKQFNWLVLGLLGFLLFTVVGVYFRQKLFGF